MPIQNDFLPFAAGAGANVLTQAQYAALTSLIANGFSAGVAPSAQLNKVWRQSSIMTAVLAQFIVANTGQTAIDDGTTATLLANLATAISVTARQNPVLADTGAANAYVVANLAAFSAYPTSSGLTLDVSIANANTGASTLNVDGLGAKPILGLGLQPLQGGELPAKGVACLLYVVASTVNGGNGAWVVMECTGGAQQVTQGTQSNHAVTVAQAAGVVGQARNLKVNNAVASATAALTADEIIVETALGGARYCLPNFNKTINLAATGAGGMDTGTAPAYGYVALYAIYNPSTGASALLAVNATSAVAPSVYGGANMPTGYTASALVSVWPVDGNGKLVAGAQLDREVWIPEVAILTTSTVASTPTSVSVSTIVPPNARAVRGTMVVNNNTVNGGSNASFVGNAQSVGSIRIGTTAPASGAGAAYSFSGLPILVSQTIYYTLTNVSGSGTLYGFISGYSI
ncbi:hypothetical protein [Cupriavidus sp. USMAA2-4]|uniref:hypothetical protein n=1 Tax=Cupriavidus sp. USMAA2-4 TaxID=876364 RepID=UPI000A4C7E65|nr:hypothetical protein [Cupriavidus sp. USMAA2-4]